MQQFRSGNMYRQNEKCVYWASHLNPSAIYLCTKKMHASYLPNDFSGRIAECCMIDLSDGSLWDSDPCSSDKHLGEHDPYIDVTVEFYNATQS